MDETTIGDLTASADENGLQLALPGARAVLLSPREAGTLLSFLGRQSWKELRTGFRVPIHLLGAELSSTMTVTLVHQGTIYDAAAIDLSLTGMLVRMGECPATAGSRVVVRILMDDHLAKLEAEVVRTDGRVTALHFSNSLSGGELEPPPALGRVFSRLEQSYLQHRKRA